MPSLILGVSALLVAVVLGGTAREIKSAARTVLVKGYAERQITSDWGVWNVQLEARSPEIPMAYAKIENDSKAVLNFLTSREMPAGETQVSAISIAPIYKKSSDGRSNTNEIEFYELGQTLTVSSRNVKNIETASREISALLREGVQLSLPAAIVFLLRHHRFKGRDARGSGQ